MVKPNVLVLTGYGINCDEETSFAFEKAGAKVKRVHINDLIDKHDKLSNYQIMAFPGGFSYGDDTGAGNALSNRIRNHLGDELKEFVEKDNLVIGICNGFQVMTNLGLLPSLDGTYENPQVALLNNENARYLDRWVDLKFEGNCIWTKDIEKMPIPIAHGEGKFYASDKILQDLNLNKQIVARYVYGNTCDDQKLNVNPNGSLEDIAGITDPTGRLIGMMPHPERAIEFTQLPNWTRDKEIYKRNKIEIPNKGPGIQIFQNGVDYFK